MYFKKIPNIYYVYGIKGQEVLKPVRDVTHNVRFRKEILENITLFDEYDIKEGETPEIIADKVYGSSEYHWVILLCNQKYDYINDYPMAERALFEYTKNKYGDAYAVHHYENEQGFTISADQFGAIPISNINHETRINESKRRIKLISPSLLGSIVNEYRIV